MDSKKAFEKTISIGNEIIKKHKELNNLNLEAQKVMDKCSHDLVIKYNDKVPRKLVIDGYYVCPSCGRTHECIDPNDFEKTPFKHSRVIDLTSLSLEATKELYMAIRKEIYYNFDYYYNPETKVEELQERLEKLLKKYEVNYNPFDSILKRTKRKTKPRDINL